MIKVNIEQKQDFISKVTITGHADSDEHGKDLVCAGVSTSAVGVLNTLAKFGFIDNRIGTLEMKDGYINIVVNKKEKSSQVILETLVITLTCLELKFKEYIKITKVEVQDI